MNGSKGHKQATKNAHPNNITYTLTVVTQREETKNPPNLPGGCTCGVPASLRGAKPERREPELEQRCLPWQCTPASRCHMFSSGSASRPEVPVKQDTLCMHIVSIKAMLPRRLLQTLSVMHSVNLLTISNQAQPFITPIIHKKKYKIMYSTSDAYMHIWCESNTDNKSLLLLHLTIQKNNNNKTGPQIWHRGRGKGAETCCQPS